MTDTRKTAANYVWQRKTAANYVWQCTGDCMTDEEREKLCEALRSCPDDAVEIIAWMRMAANEIEQLTKRLQAVHGYAEECEAKIKMQADQIDRMIIKKLVS